MRGLLLASIVVLVLGAADTAHGRWRTYGARGDWRTYGVANKISPNGLWWRGYGRMGYGWYSVYGGYIGSNYSTIGFGYPNYGITAPWTSGYGMR